MEKWFVPVLVTVLVAGCSGPKKPTATLALANTAVKQAENAGASEFAPLDLRVAQDKLLEAEEHSRKEKYEQARRLAEQALVDAELAEARTEAERARQSLDETRASIRTIAEETHRTTRELEQRLEVNP